MATRSTKLGKLARPYVATLTTCTIFGLLAWNHMYKIASKKIKFKSEHNKKSINYTWILFVTVATFFVAMTWEYSSQFFLGETNVFMAIAILFLIVFIGIFFDLLGIAVTAAKEKPFHAMASKKVRGAKESIFIVRNAGSVANFFNDVVGDIANIVSGTAAITILIMLNRDYSMSSTLTSIFLTATIASITVGGKAIGKEIAIRKSNFIVFKLGCLMSIFTCRSWYKTKV